MPIYTYKCDECGETCDELRRMADKDNPAVCDSCGGEGHLIVSSGNFLFKKRWIPTKDGWVRGDM